MLAPVETKRKSRVRRASIGVAVAILSLYALYVVAINVFLSTSLSDRVIRRDPTTLYVSYERAWSIWPGSIHAHRALIRGQDSHLQWLLRVEKATFDVSLVDLAIHKRVHLEHARASGVTFDARQRVAAPAATPEYVDALPSIPGFPRIPIRSQEAVDLKERWDDAHYHLWSIELSDAIAEDVREIWIDTIRVEGTSRVAGGFLLKPIRRAEVGPAHVDIRDGRILVKERPVAVDVAGALDVTFDPFDPRIITAPELMRRISVATELHGRVPDLANLPRTVVGPLTLAGAAEVPRLALRVTRGKVETGTHLDMLVPWLRVEAAEHRLLGALAVVADAPMGSQLDLRLEGRAMRLSRLEAPDEPVVHVPAIDITASAPSLDLAEPQRTLRVAVDVPDARIADPALLRHYLHSAAAPLIANGRDRFDVHGQLAVEDAVAAGSLDVHSPDLGVIVRSLDVGAELRAHAGIHDWRIDAGDLVLDDASVVLMKLEARVEERRDAAVAVARVAASARSEHFAVDDPTRHLALSAIIEGGRLNDARVLDALLPADAKISLDAAPGAGRFAAEAKLGIDDHVGRGSVSAHAERVGIRAPRLRARGDVHAAADIHAWNLDEGRMQVTGSTLQVDRLVGQLGATVRGESPLMLASDLRARRIELRARAIDVDLESPSLHGVDYRVVVDDAVMDDAGRLGVLFPPSEPGSSSSSTFAIESGRARASADVVVSSSRHTATGGAKVSLDAGSLRFNATHVRGQFDVDVHVAGLVPGTGSAIDIAGSRVVLRGIETVGAKAHAQAWSGDLALIGGTLRASDEPAFDGFVQLNADDAAPILAIVLGNDLPGFVVGRFRAPGLSGQARIVLEQDRAAILDSHARGDDVVVIGDYVVRPQHKRGAFTVAKGAVSAGVKIDDAGASVRLFGLEAWRQQEKSSVLALFASAPLPAAPSTPAPAPAKTDVPADAKAKAARP